MYPVDSGDTTFIVLCTALVLLMTPGLAFFYGGMVRAKERADHHDAEASFPWASSAIIWIFGGFSLAFGPDVGGLFGDISYHFALDKVGAIAPSPRLCEHRAFHPVLRLPAYVRRHRPGADHRARSRGG